MIEPRVVIVGGGVGGLSAAHELAERGFRVAVFEKNTLPGGKARSVAFRGQAERPLPGEHGFRFFPGFYRHLPDTLARIPVGAGRTVADSLVAVERMMFAHSQHPPLVAPCALPKSWHEVKLVAGFLRGLLALGLTLEDIVFYLGRMWRVLTSCDERREQELERETWWRFVDAEGRTRAFQELLVIGVTRNLVAAKAEKANARTVGLVGIQLLRDLLLPGRTADRILDGPTSEVWIEPWVEHLQRLGVTYEEGWALDRVRIEDGRARAVVLRRSRKGKAASADDERRTVRADHLVLALPVEAMAELLERQPELLAAAPDLAGIPELARDVAWMNGIQYYLTADVPICPGHVNYLDSPWALTSICHSQFWPRHPPESFGDGTVKTVLSVDVSDWATEGFNGKEAWDCTRGEVAREVWAQLKHALNHGDRVVLRDDMLHPRDWYFVDDNIDERRDKDETAAIPDPVRSRRRWRKVITNRKGEPDLLTNAEPLLVNVADTWRLRPEAQTRVPNLFLAADYVRTHTNLATMEAANEAARRAVNGILRASGSAAAPCDVFPLEEPFAWLRARDAARFRDGRRPWTNVLGGAAGARLAAGLVSLGLRAFLVVTALPASLVLFSLLAAGGLAVLGAHFDAAWRALGTAACGVLAGEGPGPFVTACAEGLPARTWAGVSVFWFGAYAVLFGLSLFLLPAAVLRRLGFPRQEGPWMLVLGTAPILIGILYVTAALFELRPFFWAIVFGRVAVFLVCLHLGYVRRQGTGLLVWAAVPDVVGAFWTAIALVPRWSAGLLLVFGLGNVLVAAAFHAVPPAVRRKLGFPEAAGSWLSLSAALLAFWGAYEVLAALTGMVPLFWASAACHLLLGAVCVAGALHARRRRLAAGGLAFLAQGLALALLLRQGL